MLGYVSLLQFTPQHFDHGSMEPPAAQLRNGKGPVWDSRVAAIATGTPLDQARVKVGALFI